MPMQPSDRIFGPARGSAAAALAVARAGGAKRLDELERYLDEVWRLAPALGIDPAIVAVQSALETADWTDRWWSERLNPAGIGITGDPRQNEASMTWASGVDSARGQIVHLWLYARGKPLADVLAPFAALDPRRDALPASWLGASPTLESLGRKWSVVPDYGKRIANRAGHIFPGLADQQQDDQQGHPQQDKEPTMGWQKVRFEGLDRDVWLPDDITVEKAIIPDSMIGWVRSGTASTAQTTTTFHDTGTPGASARNQRDYLHNGPMEWKTINGENKLVRRQVGFNFAVDDQRIIQLIPLNEVTWAAGTPEGNRTSWHTEQCFGGSIDWDRSLRNALALHAGLIAAKGWSADTALVPHQKWYGKWCPGQILNKDLWPTVLNRAGSAVGQALAQLGSGGGTTGGPGRDLADPLPVAELAPYQNGDADTIPPVVRAADGTPFFFVGDRVRATRATRRLQRADPASASIGPDLKAGDEFYVSWIFIGDADNEPYYLTPFNTRILVADTERIGDRPETPPAPVPQRHTAEGDGAVSPDEVLVPEERATPAGGSAGGIEIPADELEVPGH